MASDWAIGYVRVSSDEQALSGASRDMQEERIRAFCLMAGLSLRRMVREERVSGAKALASRPGGSQVVLALAERQATHLVALKLDRLFRDTADALTRIRGWDRAGIALHLVDMGGSAINSASAMGRMMLTILAGFAEWERNLIAERTTSVLAHKKAHLEAYSPTPLGYRRDGSRLVAEPDELLLVSRMRAMREDGWSLARIAGHLNATGAPTKKGGRWHASTIRYLLNNHLYDDSASYARARLDEGEGRGLLQQAEGEAL